MNSVILGTAGHVDHGKTALIEALTGTNTDRWEEERRRGITIDLGFARFPDQTGDPEISVVDVPGHEDFVKNMLAGATGVDVLLLVVAADEGPMPQTLEHLWIARLLGVRHGVAALTKSDLVEPDWQELARDAVAKELERVFGSTDWPVIPVSAVSGDGLEQLTSAIRSAARSARQRPAADLFRLPVDRSFTVRGVGTVVTGTVWSGQIATGAELRLLPADKTARLRGIQRHGQEVQIVSAGQRAALALVGIDRGEVRRGQVLVSDGVWRPTRLLDTNLTLLPGTPRPLRHWQRVRFHLGTAETLARVVLYDDPELPPGQSALAQLRLEEPVVARAGDRFVIRFYSPVTTIGGGTVVDPWAHRRRRLSQQTAAELRARSMIGSREALERAVAGQAAGASTVELAVAIGLPPAEIAAELQDLREAGAVRQLGEGWHSTEALDLARAAVLELLRRGHDRDTGARGVGLESLRSEADQPAALVDAVLADLECEEKVRIDGSLAALAGHVPRLQPEQQKLADAAVQRLRQAGLAPPGVKELASALGVRGEALLPVLKFKVDEGALVAVTADLYLDSGAIREVKRRVGEVLGTGGVGTPSQLREALGVSRKYLIPLLEYLDAVGFTRRTAEGRVLREV